MRAPAHPKITLWCARALYALARQASEPRRVLSACDGAAEIVGIEIADGVRRADALAFMRWQVAEVEQSHPREVRPLFASLDRFARLFALDPVEREILEVATAASTHDALSECFGALKTTLASRVAEFIGAVIGSPAREVARALKPAATLASAGLVQSVVSGADCGPPWRQQALGVRSGLERTLAERHRTDDSMLRAFFQRAPRAELTLRDFEHLGRGVHDLRALLEGALRTHAVGVNVLVYGPSGTGKTELARLLAQLLRRPLYEVSASDSDGDPAHGGVRLGSYQLCQRMLGRSRVGLVVFDEAEDVFPYDGFSLLGRRRQSSDHKAFTNKLLEQNPVPTIWISNAVEQMDRAFQRRFDFHLEMRIPPMAVRRSILRRHLGKRAVCEGWIERAARCEQLSPADVKAAARVARLTRQRSRPELEATLDHALAARLVARGDKWRTEAPSDGVPYDVRFLNTSHDLGSLADALAAGRPHDARRAPRRRPRSAPRTRPRSAATRRPGPSGSILLYGPPGTGKTAFCRHVAERIGRPLLVRRASDLLSKWVGDTEQLIAAMFREASTSGAVLLLDEADGLLRERRSASHGWELTQVNELLVGMEEHRGLVFCATNLVDELDHASLRRFTLKVRFDYLEEPQAWALLVAFLESHGMAIDDGTEPHPLRRALAALTNLTPGDFATIGRRFALLGQPTDPVRVIALLADECHGKHDQESRVGRVGFR